ncbi:MAG: diadenylate cyclase CdaA [Bacteroidales bacterium]
MHIGPVPVRFLDIIDILLVAFLMYQVYILIKGSIAIYLFITVLAFWMLWWLVKDNLMLLGSILGQVISVGAIALIVVFQPELRKFLVLFSTRYLSKSAITLDNLFPGAAGDKSLSVNSVIKACINMAKNRTGALIVLKRKSLLDSYENTGDKLDALISSRLLESVFNKYSPLHDGAVIIINNKIRAARCILPVSDNFELPANYGLRHRAAIGLTEETDALVIIISEETGEISLAESGRIKRVDTKVLFRLLEKEFVS